MPADFNDPTNVTAIQEELRSPGVTVQKLMEYANGQSQAVPSWLALMELNRRKQISETARASEAPQSSVKDQTVNALLGRQNQVNPAAGIAGINPAAAPRMVNPAAAPAGMNPAAAPQMVNPAARPQPVQAAEGGLMSIPVDMFQTQNYAGGGIVAFARGGSSDDYVETPGGLNVLRSEIDDEMSTKKVSDLADRPSYTLGGQKIQGPRSFEAIRAEMSGDTEEPENLTPEQLYARRKQIQKMAGVSEDPYAEAKAARQKYEERQQKGYEGQGLERLLAQMNAFAQADPTKGFGVQMSKGAEASAALEKEQNALRDKQELAAIEFKQNMAKEEDARRRGDAAAVEAAQEAQRKNQMEYAKLQNQIDQTASSIMNAETAAAKLPIDIYNAQSMAAYHQGMVGAKPTQEDRALEKVRASLNADPKIKALAKQLETMEPSSPEYNNILDEVYRLSMPYYKQAGVEPPEKPEPSGIVPPAKKQGFWANLLGYGSPAPTKAVPFDQLPK